MTPHLTSYQPVAPIFMAPWAFVENAQTMAFLLDSILEAPQGTPSLFIDLEGENLGRNGTICIMQIFDAAKGFTWLVDICTLGREAFDTEANCSRISLRRILECAIIPKVFYDVRNDSDALFAHFGIALQGIQDLQYMEVATRKQWEDKTRLRSLAGCIQEHLELNEQERKEIIETKAMGRSLFSPSQGGSYAVLKERPLREEIIEYCVSDVKYMAALWYHYSQGLDERMWRRVLTGSCQRVAESQSKDFSTGGEGKKLVIEGWGLREGDDGYVSLSDFTASQVPVASMATTNPQPNAKEITVTITPTTAIPKESNDSGSSSHNGASIGADSSSLSDRQTSPDDDSMANTDSWTWADGEGWGVEDSSWLAQDHEWSGDDGNREAETGVVWSAFEGCSSEWLERVSLIVW